MTFELNIYSPPYHVAALFDSTRLADSEFCYKQYVMPINTFL